MFLKAILRSLAPFTENLNIVRASSGGIGFVMPDNKVIRCDWYTTLASFYLDDNGHLVAVLELNNFCPETYVEEWAENGIRTEDVTPEKLSNAKGFDEIYLELFFVDDKNDEVFVPYEITHLSLNGIDLSDKVTQEAVPSWLWETEKAG